MSQSLGEASLFMRWGRLSPSRGSGQIRSTCYEGAKNFGPEMMGRNYFGLAEKG